MVTSHAQVEIAPERPGLNVAMGTGAAPVVSDVWAMGAWTIQFARLDPHQQLPLDHTRGPVYVKVVTGRLVEVDRGAYAAPRVIRDTRVRAETADRRPGRRARVHLHGDGGGRRSCGRRSSSCASTAPSTRR